MSYPLVGVIKQRHPKCRLRRGCLLSFVLLISPLPTIASHPRSDDLTSSSRLQATTQISNGAAQGSTSPRVLEPGKPIKRELAGGETHVYQLDLKAGQYARLTVDQQGINIALAASDQNGKTL